MEVRQSLGQDLQNETVDEDCQGELEWGEKQGNKNQRREMSEGKKGKRSH
jgi:hypothetical protein